MNYCIYWLTLITITASACGASGPLVDGDVIGNIQLPAGYTPPRFRTFRPEDIEKDELIIHAGSDDPLGGYDDEYEEDDGYDTW